MRAKPIELVAPSAAKQLVTNAEPWNGFLLANPRFGLTIDELESDLKPEFKNAELGFDVCFLPSGDVVLRAIPSGSWLQKVDQTLVTLKPAVSKIVSSLGLAAATALCAVDSSLNVLRREDEGAGNTGGWSQVAKGATGMKRVQQESIGRTSSFTVLGRIKKASEEKEKEKKVQMEKEAVDDWEKEVEG